jgi:alkylation response protein AidB-like acyl-CoA dehydrogenase
VHGVASEATAARDIVSRGCLRGRCSTRLPRARADGETLIRAARGLAPEILASRGKIESERRLPEPLVDKMRAAGFFELWLPEAFGGPALHPQDFLILSRLAPFVTRRAARVL